MSRRHLPTKPAPRYTTAEKLAMRRKKRKLGPAAKRRAERRVDLQPKTEVAS